MKKEDLKMGMVMENENGDRFLVVSFNNNYIIGYVSLNGDTTLEVNELKDNLKNNNIGSYYDIQKVYKDYTCQELLWERKRIPYLNIVRIILKNLPLSHRNGYIARDESKELFVYIKKPVKSLTANHWTEEIGVYSSEKETPLDLSAFSHLFEFIEWEDEEPYLIQSLIDATDK